MKITFLGVMGSLPGGISDLGKNTTSILLEDSGESIIIDAGTGIINYFEQTQNNEHHIIFTHYHLDHILGLPFVKGLFDSKNSFFLYGPNLNGFSTSKLLPSILTNPFLPFNIDDVKANINHRIINENEQININGFTLKNYIVDHPGKAMVYSININDLKVTILTDLPNNSQEDSNLMLFCENSDLIYVDSYFLDEEIINSNQQDFGHSSIESAIKIKKLSKSKVLVLGHHKYNRKRSELEKYATDDIIIAVGNLSITI